MKKFLCYDTNDAASGKINVDSRGMLKPNSTVPTGGTPYQQLVTDGTGIAKWGDRLCYINSEFRELLPLTTLDFEAVESGYYGCSYPSSAFSGLTSGSAASIMLDGQQYNLTIKEAYGNMYLGNAGLFGLDDTGEPFLVMVSTDGFNLMTTLPGTSHRVSISAQVTEKKQLAKEYLSEDVVVFTEQEESTGMPDSISWTGNTGDSQRIVINALNYYKISELTPSVEALIDSSYITNVGTIQTIYGDEIKANNTDDSIAFRDIVVFYKTGTVTVRNNNSIFTVSVPEVGIYVQEDVRKINFNQTVLKKGIIIPSSTYKSEKKFFLAVDDSGTISATEVTS